MQTRQVSASSAWFSSLVALLVAIGAQTVLESIVPANLSSTGGISHVDGNSLWAGAAAIRFVSFLLGGFVSVLLARALSTQLIALLLIVSVLAAVFAQFPAQSSIPRLVAWSITGPIGIILGAWAAYAKRADA